MNDQFPIAKNGADIHAITTVLDRLAFGEIATYADISEAIGRDCQKHRYLIEKALSGLERKRKIFSCVKNVGYQRLSDSEIVECSFVAFKRIRKSARRHVTRLSSVEWRSLSRDEQLRHNLHISALGAIAHIATPSNIAKMSQACSNGSLAGLPTASALKLMAS